MLTLLTVRGLSDSQIQLISGHSSKKRNLSTLVTRKCSEGLPGCREDDQRVNHGVCASRTILKRKNCYSTWGHLTKSIFPVSCAEPISGTSRPQDEIVIDSCRVARVVYRILANVEQTSDLAVGKIATTVVR